MKAVAMLFAVVAGGLALAGCGGDGPSETTAATTAATPPAATNEMTVTLTTPATPATPAAEKPKPRTITIVVRQGRPQGGIQRPAVEKGERVVLVIRADAGEQVHLHGYDIEKAVTPGTPVRIPFTANVPGRFELELHHPDALLAVVEVRP